VGLLLINGAIAMPEPWDQERIAGLIGKMIELQAIFEELWRESPLQPQPL